MDVTILRAGGETKTIWVESDGMYCSEMTLNARKLVVIDNVE